MKRTAVPPRFALFVGFLLVVPTVWPAQPSDPPAVALDALTARNIGAANMSGRITEVAVVESNPAIIYAAAASGGVWKTADAGVNWAPVFDGQTSSSIGAVAVSRSNPDHVWVGAGEANARNSVTWGDGVFRSTDGGKTWQHVGLKETQHIGRIVIHPANPEIVYVAALGRIWGPNKERGVYKTANGGRTWDLVKFVDENTGFIDVAMDLSQPDTLYAAAYCVRRDGFSGGNPDVQTGPGAGLYRTIDGGKSWTKMTKGLPNRPYGRCGFDIYRQDPRTVYAVIQTDKTSVTVQGQAANLTKRTVVEKGQKVTEDITADHGGIFRSDDRGETWTRLNSLCPRPFYYGQIRVDPNDVNNIYVLGIAFHTSKDGGRTFTTGGKGKGKGGAHPDHHALWINPKNSNQLVLGNDGGLYLSQNRGANWQHVKKLPVSQFYAIAVDMRKPYRVYGGLQDNGSWGGASATRNIEGIGLSDWYRILGADGFHCQVDPTDFNIVYAEAQYGKPQRIDLRTGKGKAIQPKGGGETYRFNWSSPMLLSPHNPRVLYYGGNRVFRSENRGDTWKVISPDLTYGKPGPSKSTGHTLTTIAESPLKAGLVWAGSDDGRIHVTRDTGGSWTEVTKNVPGLPRDCWISRLECSHFAEGTAYLTVDRHRNDDRKPYVFKTTDYGKTWKSLAAGLPQDASVNVIRESSRNKDLLFVGTEYALFASLDGGAHWQRLRGGLPTAPMHDLVIHPRDRDLVIGTHGRGIYVMDIWPLESLTPKVAAAAAHLFDVRPAVAFKQRKSTSATDAKGYLAPNPPYGATIWFHLKSAPAQAPTVTILDREGNKVASVAGAKRSGLQQVVWPLRAGQGDGLVRPGEYVARLQFGDVNLTKTIRVEAEE